MKRLLVVILSVVLVETIRAQQNGAPQPPGLPDMGFSINFAPVDGTSSNLNMSGECNYGRFVLVPYLFPGEQTYTNSLEVTIILPSQPDSALVLDKNNDGTFKAIGEVTNYFISGYGNFIQQRFTLTEKQIHSLIEGNFYAEVDFGGNKYIGNLTPQYQNASGPTPVFSFHSPVFIHTLEYGYVVIAKDNQNADVVISATESVDPYYLPMGYTWTWNIYDLGPLSETNTGPTLRHTFRVDNPNIGYYIGLQAHDPIAAGDNLIINLGVFTPAEAANYIMPSIEYLPVSQNKIENLTEQLSKASKYFDQGNIIRGRHELVAFIQQIENLHSKDLTSQWILEYSQRLLESLN